METERGQHHFTEAIYHLTICFEPNRPVIVNDGWEHTVSDIVTLHDCEEAGEKLKNRYTLFWDNILTGRAYHNDNKSALANGYEYRGQPVIISEFGGIAFDGDSDGWGYGSKVHSKEEFLRRFDNIASAIKAIPQVCGYCYTQLTDVQQEINGLMKLDRTLKVDLDKVSEVNP